MTNMSMNDRGELDRRGFLAGAGLAKMDFSSVGKAGPQQTIGQSLE